MGYKSERGYHWNGSEIRWAGVLLLSEIEDDEVAGPGPPGG